MRHMLVTLTFLAFAMPAMAQDTDEENGLSLMERGAQMLMEGLMKEMEPALEGIGELGPQLRQFAQEMGPALRDLLSRVEDWSVYHPPEVLPNGDIIIRRKEPLTPEPDGNAPIDL